MARIADTSFLYAAFDTEDPRHEEARDEIAKPQGLGIPLSVMAEFLFLLDYRKQRKVALQAHANLTSLPTFSIVAIKDEAKVLEIWAKNKDLSVFDAAGIQACIEAKGTLLSYDTKQVKALAELAGR